MYILYILGPSAFPVLLFLLSIPSALGVPGVSLFLGFAQASLALQMLTGVCVCVCLCVCAQASLAFQMHTGVCVCVFARVCSSLPCP